MSEELRQEDLDFELSFYNGLLEKNPNFIEALIALGDLYTKAGLYHEGLAIDERLYVLKPEDPVVLYSATVASLADGSDETAKLFRVTAPLAMIDEIWTQGDIGPGRRAVMTRPTGPHVPLLARADDRPVGVAFVALDKDIAMIHDIKL